MNARDYLFPRPWHNILAIVAIISLAFLDKVISPWGIPIAVIAALILFRIRMVSVRQLGLYRPKNWLHTVALGVSIGVFIPAFGIFVLSPFREWLGIAMESPSIYSTIEGNNQYLILFLIVSWTTAGFGEELLFRSFFIGQFSSAISKSRYRYLIALSVSSILFGIVHAHNGLGAVIATGVNGFILGLLYLYTKRNIWASYLAHALADTIAFLIIYTGLYHHL